MLILVCASALGALDASRAIVTTRLNGIPVPWPTVVAQNMWWWYVWAALTPLVFWVSRRWPIAAARRGARNAAALLVAGVMIASLHVWISAPLFFALSHPVWRRERPLSDMLVNWHLNFIVSNLVTYAMIVGLFHAMEAKRRYDESRLRALRLEQQASELKHGIAEAKLESLQKELNPHFLFNTLNAISGLARRREHDAVISMLARLGTMLRATLDRDLPAELTLRDELALLQHYVAIEQVRFGERLTVTIDVPPALSHVLVPTFSLQPLVENAVRHGVSKIPGPGMITVQATASEDRLRLEVRDTGPGFSDEVLAESTAGVGLSNTRSRLETLYGSVATLSLSNHPTGGAVATLWLPLQAPESSENNRH